MNITEEQRAAIEARGENLLLSAAAGSGKTTVLVERALSLISEGATLQRMLIVTFTNAAASDMKSKLARALGARAEIDSRFQSELFALESAKIMTLHAFCADFLRERFESANVAPDFRVLDAAKYEDRRDEALTLALTEAYEEKNADLLALDYGRGVKKVGALVLALSDALSERPDPEAFLAQSRALLSGDGEVCFDELLRAARDSIREAAGLYREARALAETSVPSYEPATRAEAAFSEELLSSGYDGLADRIESFRAPAARMKKDEDPDAAAVVRELRDEAKKCLQAAEKRVSLRRADALSDLTAQRPEVSALFALTKRFSEILREKMDGRGELSFGDLERRTLIALQNESVAASVQSEFDFVFVDEYQDTSDVQDEIVRRVSNGTNLFMVGDVKQSIYRFRLAEPALFSEKSRLYRQGMGGREIDLTRNFRSRGAILDFVNGVFERAMRGGDDEILYDETARLREGRTFPGDDPKVEVLVIDKNGMADAGDDDSDAEREARVIAARIRALRAENPKIAYRDIAVLTRVKTNVSGAMAEVLRECGIPACEDGSAGYAEAYEVQFMLSLLSLLTNERNDEALIAALRSPLCGLSCDELSEVRAVSKEGSFHDAVVAYSKGARGEKTRDFFEKLAKWRTLSKVLPPAELIERLVSGTPLLAHFAALPGGAQRVANLNALISRAKAAERFDSGGLPGFLHYVQRMKRLGAEDEQARVLGENEDVVRILSAHKSKGLEFPIVFCALLGRKYRVSRADDALTAHKRLGIGFPHNDPELAVRRDTLPRRAIAAAKEREDAAEEKRILYVMLTRAEERLFLVGSVSDIETAERRFALLRAGALRPKSFLEVVAPEENEKYVYRVISETEAMSVPAAETAEEAVPPELAASLVWRYPHEDEVYAPLKATVTGLVRETIGPLEIPPLAERPNFQKETGITGAERGTLLHRLIAKAPIERLFGLPAPELTQRLSDFADGLVRSQRMTSEERAALSVGAVSDFFASPLGQRALSSKRVEREWAFNCFFGTLLVQGMIDLCFIENDQWILLDFKTDSASDAELAERYGKQIRMYAEALFALTRIPVSEALLVRLGRGGVVSIPLSTDGGAQC